MADEKTDPTAPPELAVPAVGSKKKTPDPEPDGDLCGACWPDGWPANGDAASCSHGEWTR